MTAASISRGITVRKTAKKKYENLQTSVGDEMPSNKHMYSMVRNTATVGRYSGRHICFSCHRFWKFISTDVKNYLSSYLSILAHGLLCFPLCSILLYCITKHKFVVSVLTLGRSCALNCVFGLGNYWL